MAGVGVVITVWKLLEQPAIIGTDLLWHLVVINGKVLNISLSNGPRETRKRGDGLVLV